MRIHRFEKRQFLPVAPAEAWDFFTRPENLESITPPGMEMKTSTGGGQRLFDGQIVSHHIRIAPFCYLTWVSEIKNWVEGVRFTDDQRLGPYRFWHHQHEFLAEGNGVCIVDTVHYAVGRGWFGSLVHHWYGRKMLRRIFDFREGALQRRFPGSP